MPATYRFSIGPWNISEGRDPYGPEVRPAQPLSRKLAAFKKAGFDAVMLHDDDAVPDIDSKSPQQVLKEAKQLADQIRGEGLEVEMVAPRLWFSPSTVDGGFTSNRAEDREYAIKRSLQSVDIAGALGTELIVLWLAREGTYLRESKSYARSLEYLADAVNRLLAHHPGIRVAIEPKPNEPVDVAYLPTPAHVIAFAQLTSDPSRVGCVIESAHSILAGLDPADELEFALAHRKLWSIHLNDQNGLKFDQDKPFGSANLRAAFNQIRVLERHGYGTDGKSCVAFDTHAFRTSGEAQGLDHATNSRKTFLRLLEKARSFDEKRASELVAARDYQALDQLVIDHLLGGNGAR